MFYGIVDTQFSQFDIIGTEGIGLDIGTVEMRFIIGLDIGCNNIVGAIGTIAVFHHTVADDAVIAARQCFSQLTFFGQY